MTSTIPKILPLLRRDLAELRSPRTLAILGIFTLFQFFLSMSAKVHGRVEDSLLVFQMGGIIAVMIAFDLLSRERENHTLDLLLIQGISRSGLFFVKWLAMIIFCCLGALGFMLGDLAGMLLHGFSINGLDLIIGTGMTAWLLSFYGSVSLLFSTIFRRSKWALIGSALVWVLFRPAVLALMLITPLQKALNWSKDQVWQFLSLLPDFAYHVGLDPVRGTPQGVIIQPAWSYLALFCGVLFCSAAAAWIFARQDEPV